MKLLGKFNGLFKSLLSSIRRPGSTSQTVSATQASTIKDVTLVSGQVVIIYADGRREPFDSSKARQHYLEAIVNSSRFSRWAGEQYIPEQAQLIKLDVAPKTTFGIFNKDTFPSSQPKRLPDQLKEVLAREKLVLILGELGIGKSTSLEKLMYEYAQKCLLNGADIPLPIYVPLNRFTGNLWECLRSAFNETAKLELTIDQAQNLLSTITCLILFDGLNELGPHLEEGVRAIRIFRGDCHQHVFVFTCRTYEYNNELSVDTAIEIQLLEIQGTLNYLTLQLGSEKGEQLYRNITTDRQLDELARNPLLLQMIIEVSQEVDLLQAGNLPRNRGRLLQMFVARLLWREAEHHLIPRQTREHALARLACSMHTKNVDRYAEVQVRDCLAAFLEQWHEKFNWRDLLRELRADDILQNVNNEWFYRHRAFQEFFAAVEIVSQEDKLDTIISCLEDQWWHQVILFIVGIIEDVNERHELVTAIAESDPFLAYRAVMACDDTEVPQTTRQHVAAVLIEQVLMNIEDGFPEEATEALIQLGEVIVAPLLKANLDDESGVVLEWTVDIVRNFAETAEQELVSMLPESDDLERYAIVRLLGRIGDENIATPLMGLLDDEKPEVVAETIKALGDLGLEEATDRLRMITTQTEWRTEDGISLAILAQEALDKIQYRSHLLQRTTINSNN